MGSTQTETDRGPSARAASLPRSVPALLLRLEGMGVKAALGLPAGVKRKLAGPPVTRDGQALATETQLMLRLAEVAGKPDPGALPVAEGRAALREQSMSVAGTHVVAEVRELEVAGRPARLYVPRGLPPGAGPLLVFFHGGGFMHGDLDTHDGTCRFITGRAGVRVLSVDYRLGPEHTFPAAHDDAFAAYEWVLEHADELDADRDHIGVGGDSAGGNLAAAVAIHAARQGWPCTVQLLVYPATDCADRSEHRSASMFAAGFYLTSTYMDAANEAYAPDPEDRRDWRLSPLRMPSEDLPEGLAPALVATAGFDPLRDEGEAYARKLSEAGVEVQLTRYPDQVHGFLNVVGVGSETRAINAEIATRVGNALRREPDAEDPEEPDTAVEPEPDPDAGTSQPGTQGPRDPRTGSGSADTEKTDDPADRG